MNGISDLHQSYLRIQLGLAPSGALMDWAVTRLQADEEGDDREIALLAWPESEQAALSLTETILRRYAPGLLDPELLAGKSIVELRARYLRSELSIVELDSIISRLYVRLGYPNWMVMLSRNCEYATAVDHSRKPFEEEFQYIAELWANSSTLESFNSIYRREVSNSHDGLTPES